MTASKVVLQYVMRLFLSIGIENRPIIGIEKWLQYSENRKERE
jgi:hypothetical protein